MPNCSLPKRSAQKQLLLPSNIDTMSSSEISWGGGGGMVAFLGWLAGSVVGVGAVEEVGVGEGRNGGWG